MTKSEVREQIKLLCRQNKQTLAEESNSICEKIINSEQYKNAEEIFSYMALPDEADLTKVMITALKEGKKVAVPKIISQEQSLIKFFYLDAQKTFTEQTSDGTYGIAEPNETQPAEINANKKTLILVPGRAFTKEGDRLGRGKGYYDRFLKKNRLPNITVAGVCFSFQVLPELPTDPNDVKMDVVYTTSQE